MLLYLKMSNTPLNYQQWLQQAVARLSVEQSSEDAKIDANALLCFVTEKSKAQIMAFAETRLSEAQQQRLELLLQRRLQGEPIAYILGEKGFWRLDLLVSPVTLIPRADTECLVETALSLLQHYSSEVALSILDLGTGTGAIALALASELTQQKRDYRIIGVDCVAESVLLAKQNRQRNHLTNIEFMQSDWFSSLPPQKFDFIVSNPPYIAENDPHLKQGDVRFEPLSALVAKKEGLADIERIIEQATEFMNTGGYLLIEHGWQQAEAVQALFKRYNWCAVKTVLDYGGNQRVTYAKWDR